MKKIEKIKEAYGIQYEALKDDIDEDGWLLLYSKEHGTLYDGLDRFNIYNQFPFSAEYQLDSKKIIEYKSGSERSCMRPITLNGIEYNNGWTKIEDRLPEFAKELKEVRLYFVYTKTGFIDVDNNLNLWFWKEKYTHYQDIEHPKPPLY